MSTEEKCITYLKIENHIIVGRLTEDLSKGGSLTALRDYSEEVRSGRSQNK